MLQSGWLCNDLEWSCDVTSQIEGAQSEGGGCAAEKVCKKWSKGKHRDAEGFYPTASPTYTAAKALDCSFEEKVG